MRAISMSLFEYLQVPLFQKAFLGAFLSGMGLSLLGVVVLTLNLTTVRFALMHVALLGAAVSMVAGFPPLPGAMIAIGIAALLMGPAGDYIQADTGAIGVLFMTGSLGLAFMLFYKAGVSAMDAFALFTGNILALQTADLWAIGILAGGIVFLFIVFYREIQLVLYNPDLAEGLGVPVKLIRNGLLLLTGLAIGVNFRMVGALLIDAAVLLPAMAALTLARGLKGVLALSAVFGIVSQVGGLAVSMAFDLPSGASITLAAVGLVCLTSILKGFISKIRRVNWK
jgi:zinc transport system permease protein